MYGAFVPLGPVSAGHPALLAWAVEDLRMYLGMRLSAYNMRCMQGEVHRLAMTCKETRIYNNRVTLLAYYGLKCADSTASTGLPYLVTAMYPVRLPHTSLTRMSQGVQ